MWTVLEALATRAATGARGVASSQGSFGLVSLGLSQIRSTCAGTPQLPFKIPHIPTNGDHRALNRGTLGGLGGFSIKSRDYGLGICFIVGDLDP